MFYALIVGVYHALFTVYIMNFIFYELYGECKMNYMKINMNDNDNEVKLRLRDGGPCFPSTLLLAGPLIPTST